MKEQYSHIAIVLDRSGSMSSIKDDTIGGFNSFLKSQKEEEGEATFFLAQFDNEYQIIQDNVDIKNAKELTNETFIPRGATALYDAIGRTINSVGKFLSDLKEEERPSKVFFVVITDGMENSSFEFTSKNIKDMIEEQQNKYSWKFIFIGSDINSINEANDLGFKKDFSLHFANNSKGTNALYSSMSRKMSVSRNTTEDLQCFFDQSDYDIQNEARK